MTYGQAGHALGVRPEQPQVRRRDRHGPDPVGRRAAADHLERAAAGSARATPASSSRAGTCRSTGPPHPGPSAWRDQPQPPPRRSKRSAVADAGADAGRRRWILTRDEAAFRTAPGRRPRALLPSGDAYFLLYAADRELLSRTPAAAASSGHPGSAWRPPPLGGIAGTWRAGTVVRADLAAASRRNRSGHRRTESCRCPASTGADRRPLGRLKRVRPPRCECLGRRRTMDDSPRKRR